MNTPIPQHYWGVVLAAGQGTRLSASLGQAQAKQFLPWQGKPLWWHSACALAACPRVQGLVLVFPENDLAEAKASLEKLDAAHVLGVPWLAVPGGDLRQHSVHKGLLALQQWQGPLVCERSAVLVHDSARPFVQTALVNRLVLTLQESLAGGSAADQNSALAPHTEASQFYGVVPSLAVTDTVKKAVPQSRGEASTPKLPQGCHRIDHTVARENLYTVQTPQLFLLPPLLAAHAQAEAEAWTVTDDASLLEHCGLDVVLMPGDPTNRKITHAEDLSFLKDWSLSANISHGEPVCGYGYDVHAYGGERTLKLGNVPIPGPYLVRAHSDGDVLLHALMDAMLGCAACGDIGQHFPDNNPAYENISSAVLLEQVIEIISQRGLRLTHVDVTVVAQKPRIAPHAEAIRRNIARLLNLEQGQVNVKATTEEGLGFTGKLEGIKAVALVTGLRPVQG